MNLLLSLFISSSRLGAVATTGILATPTVHACIAIHHKHFVKLPHTGNHILWLCFLRFS